MLNYHLITRYGKWMIIMIFLTKILFQCQEKVQHKPTLFNYRYYSHLLSVWNRTKSQRVTEPNNPNLLLKHCETQSSLSLLSLKVPSVCNTDLPAISNELQKVVLNCLTFTHKNYMKNWPHVPPWALTRKLCCSYFRRF